MASSVIPVSGAAADSGAPITELIRARMAELSDSLQRVALKVLADPAAVAHYSADELARQTEVSQASVTRFCKALGLANYQALVLGIAEESGRAAGRFTEPAWETTDIDVDISADDDANTILRALTSTGVRSLQLAAQTIDVGEIDRAVGLLAAARRVDVYGTGASGLMAEELEMALFRVGYQVRAWTEAHTAHTSAALLTRRDVAVAFSFSGNTRETCEALSEAKNRGARTIAITSTPRSPVGRLADITLVAYDRDRGARVRSFGTRHAQLLLVDLLYVRLAQLDYERSAASIALTSHIASAHAAGGADE